MTESNWLVGPTLYAIVLMIYFHLSPDALKSETGEVEGWFPDKALQFPVGRIVSAAVAASIKSQTTSKLNT